MEKKIGKITDIVFYNDNNGYTIAIMETEEEIFTVVGTLPRCHVGGHYELKGTFIVHPKYGEQFSFTHGEEIMPSTEAGIEGFLASSIIKGIGPKTAGAIVAKFGKDSLKVMEERPQDLALVPGIGQKKAQIIGEAYKEHREFAKISVFFQEYGISTSEALKLYRVYGAESVEIVKENPYAIIEDVSGIGFRKADAMARKLGFSEDDPFRIASGVLYTLSYFAGEGNTYLPEEELCQKASGLLNVSRDEIKEAIVSLAFEGKVHLDRIDQVTAVYLYGLYKAEQQVCKALTLLSETPPKTLAVDIDGMIRRTEARTGINLSDNQQYAVKSCFNSGVSIITGGPGTGKTTIINAIIEVLEESGLKPAIAAPTGRAAKRITETSGHYASTIHRLLGFYYSEDRDEMVFAKNQEDPLDYDAVIVDEASMIDIVLMNGLLKAIKPGTRLIMVGDVDQLPSVGPGRVLKDMIDSEYIFTVKLTEIFRQAQESMIVVNAHRINRGEYPYCNEKDKDFFLVRRSKETDMVSSLMELVQTRLPQYYEWCNPMKDIQVLTPMKKGLLGTENLNQVLQEMFNPPRADKTERKSGARVFRQGDKVMQIKNNYQIGWKRLRDFSEGEGVFNGDVGYIQSIDKEYGQVNVVFDEDRFVTYEFSQLEELELAYAVTVHKSQGSEYPIVVMPMTWFPPMLANRNLLYTAVTRGKEGVVIIGSEDRMKAMVDNNKITQRFSGLEHRLRKVFYGM